MTHDKLENEIQITRFLLGDMPEDERVSFEERFLADGDLFERVRVIEDESIEAYIRGTLDPAAKEKFEKNYLATAERRQRVAFTRHMLGKLSGYGEIIEPEKTHFLASILALLRPPAFAGGAALALLLASLLGWYLWRSAPRPGLEIVRQETPTSVLTPVPPVIDNRPVRPNTDKIANEPPVNSNRNENKPPPPTVVTLALFAGTLRSGGSTSVLELPKNARGANLVLNLEAQDYKSYRAEVVDQDGNLVYRSGGLTSHRSKLNFYLPVRDLKNGDYMVRLSGLDSANHAESAADFQFRVNRK